MMCWFTFVFCAYALLSIATSNNDPANLKQILDTVPVNGAQMADPCADNNTLFIEVGQTLYHCLNNTRMIFGCKFVGAILSDGDTIIRDNYFLQCQINEARDAASMVEIACYVDNRILGPGQTYIDGHEFYTCTWNNETQDLSFEKTGCVDDQKKLVKEGQTVTMGYYNYRCAATIEDPQTIRFRLVKAGCALNNYSYQAGRMIIIGDYWYTCERSQNMKTNEIDYSVTPGGCIVDFGFLNVGEIFHKKAYIYKCEETTSSSNFDGERKSNQLPANWPFQKVRRIVVGCLEVTPKKTMVEHFPGDKWIETRQGQQKFVVECGRDEMEPGRRLSKVTTECYLDQVKGQQLAEPKTMKPGCISRVKNALWLCTKMTNGQLISTVDEKAGLEETVRAILSGFTFC